MTKRFAFTYNAGGYFSQKTEIPTAFGDLANQWSIGDYDLSNHRIPIYHIVATGNDITIQIEGLLQHVDCVNAIKENLTISDPVTGSASQRQYMSIMQDRVGIGVSNPEASLDINGGAIIRGWDAVLTSKNTEGNNLQLIGTYQGWNKNTVYIAGYNASNLSDISTTSVSFGGSGAERLWINLLNGHVGIIV